MLKVQKRAWVLSAWQVVVKRYPKLGENIKVITIPYGFRGFIGMRNFILETAGGEKLAWANSYWSFINTETGVPEKLTPTDTEPYDLGDKIDMDYAPRRSHFQRNGRSRRLLQCRSIIWIPTIM